MARAARLAITYAFDQDGIEVMHWRAYVGNWASRRTAWRCGFRVEGTVRQLLSANGRRYDAWVGSLAKGEPMEPAHRWLDVPVLEGERVRLRPWREDDAPATDPAPDEPGRRFLGGFVLTRESFDDWLTAQRTRIAEGEAVGLVHRRPRDRPAARPHPLLQAGAGADRRQRHGRLLAPPRGPRPRRRDRGPRAAGRACLRRPRRRGPRACTGWRRAPTSTTSPPSGCCERAGFTRVGTEHAMIGPGDDGPPTDACCTSCSPRPSAAAPALDAGDARGGRGAAAPVAANRRRPRRQACTDPVTRHWLGGSLPSPYTVHEARSYLRGRAADLREGSALSWCVADPATDECLGAVSVMHLLEEDGTGGEIGYWAHPQARGRGVTVRGGPAGRAPRLRAASPTAAWDDAGCGSTSPTATTPSRAGGAARRVRGGRPRPARRAPGRRLVRRPAPLRPARVRVRRSLTRDHPGSRVAARTRLGMARQAKAATRHRPPAVIQAPK